MTVEELVAALKALPQGVTVVIADSQDGDRPVRLAEEAMAYAEGARIVRLIS